MEIYNKVLEMLGVEEKEIFKIKGLERNEYFFDNGHLYYTSEKGTYPTRNSFISLVTGKLKIYRKTYKDDFLEKFPNASIGVENIPKLCWSYLYGTGGECDNTEMDCKDCWNREMK